MFIRFSFYFLYVDSNIKCFGDTSTHIGYCQWMLKSVYIKISMFNIN